MARLGFSRLAVLAAMGGMASVTAASAADMRAPIYKAPPAIAPFSWTGFYIGGTAGAGWTKADTGLSAVNGAAPLYFPADIPGLTAIGSPGLSATNAIVGAKAGYNQQWGSFVAGIEGDISWFHFARTAATSGSPFLTFPAGTAAFSTSVSTNWLATIRPRVGYAVDKALFYATGGVAIGDVRYSNNYVGFSPLGAGFEFEAATVSQTRVGWTVGAGIDYAITPHWIVSGEYLHVDLGSVSTSALVTTGNAATATFNVSTKLRSDIGRLGLAYKF
ncbi:outer membrane beta-barrel protein [Bradyrhizobium xenonodulans]|uniref:Outer membrane beta-barrel protein n=1 Tax=Bradyrhizobium xenonodulans TaxID=2736875 RepID=A0ABY7MQP8_9BRAD|nr:outer membrane beta-barrel protein [Bradyrhizobium xenonodulans]WBL79946.1 outer membrane beta-barrel protein [Bradyrhizobium xenonodulans]